MSSLVFFLNGVNFSNVQEKWNHPLFNTPEENTPWPEEHTDLKRTFETQYRGDEKTIKKARYWASKLTYKPLDDCYQRFDNRAYLYPQRRAWMTYIEGVSHYWIATVFFQKFGVSFVQPAMPNWNWDQLNWSRASFQCANSQHDESSIKSAEPLLRPDFQTRQPPHVPTPSDVNKFGVNHIPFVQKYAYILDFQADLTHVPTEIFTKCAPHRP